MPPSPSASDPPALTPPAALTPDVAPVGDVALGVAPPDPAFRALADALPALAWTARADGYIDWYNARWYAYTGTTPEQMEGWGWQRVHDPAVLPAVLERWRASIATGAPFEMTFPLRGADGVFRPFLTRVAPLRDAAGAVVRWVGTNADLTPEREAAAERERLLAESEAAREALGGANALLQEQGLELELSNQQLHEQAAELEAQAEELQATAAHLEEQTEAADRARRDAEASRQLAEAERARATGVLEATADAYFALDADFRIVGVNAAMERGARLARGRLLGRDFWEAFPGALGTALETHYRRAAAERTEAHFTHDYSDGRLDLVVEVDAYPAPGGGVAVFWRDVTARARAEAALAASDARYRALLDSIDVGFCVIEVLVDDAGRPADYAFLETNPAFVRQVGFGDPAGRRMREIAPDMEPFWFETYGRVATTGVPERFAHEAVALGRTYEVFAYRVDDPALRHVAVLFTDVTAARRAAAERERLLAESEAARAAADLERRRLAALLDQLPVGVHVAEAPSGRLLLGNAAVRRIWGHAPSPARVADYSPTYVAYHRAGPRQGRLYASDEWPLARALAAGEVVSDEVVEAERPDGSRVLVSLSAAPVRDADGRVVGGVVTSVDVTERERLLAAADAERRRAVEANEAKAQFLANMSHELRTPLNAIGGYAQLLDMGLHGPVTDDQKGALARVQAAQRHLLGLINDVLNYAKLESGRVEYDVRAVDVRAVVREVVPLVEPQLLAKGLAFDVRLPNEPCEAWADREKLAQVLVNLLSNAVKFTDARHPATGARGRVTVDVATGDDAGVRRPDALFVRVTDTGRGIPREKQEAVFEPFVQVRAAYGAPHEGTGLGLAISRDLARGMGGELRVRSAVGEGSTFTVALRRVVAADGTPVDRRTGDERRDEEERRGAEDRRHGEGG